MQGIKTYTLVFTSLYFMAKKKFTSFYLMVNIEYFLTEIRNKARLSALSTSI